MLLVRGTMVAAVSTTTSMFSSLCQFFSGMFSGGTNVKNAGKSFSLASFEACFDCAPVSLSHFVPFTRGGYHENKNNFLTQQAPQASSEPDVPTTRQTKPTKPRLSKYSETTDTTSRPPPPPTRATISDKYCPAVAENTGKSR